MSGMALALFRKHPMKKLDAQLATLIARRETLDEHLRRAQVAADEARKALQGHYLDADLADSKASRALQVRVGETESTVSAIEAAIASLLSTIAETETKIAADRDAAARKVASDAIAADAKTVEAKLEPALAQMRELAAAFDKLAGTSFEAGAVGRFLLDASNQVEFACGAVLADAMASTHRIVAGEMRIPPAPEAPAPVAVIQRPETLTIFFIRPSKWIDADGNQRKTPAFFDIELPAEQARKALKLGAAVEVDNEIRRKQHGQHQATHPQSHLCVDIDNASDLTLAEPAPPTVFQHTTRPTYQARFTQ